MRKLLFMLAVAVVLCSLSSVFVNAETAQPTSMVSVEIPTSSVDKKLKQSKTESKTSKAIEATKEATDKTVEATKKGYKKTVEATKKGYKKTVKATKEFTNKTVESTKDAFENMNPNKPVTIDDLQGKAKVKTLKNEKKELKAAFNSRIKDIDAKVKLAEKSTTMSDAQRQNTVYVLNKEKADLILQRDTAMKKYDSKIKAAKNELKKES